MDSLQQKLNQLIPQNPKTTSSKKGLGDAVESTLTKIGITQERYKEWFNLQNCNCDERKEWLNNLFSWDIKK